MNLGLFSRATSCTVAAAMVLGAVSPAAAMNVSPMTVELGTSGAKSTGRIQVLNVNPAPLPFEVRVFRIDFTDDGKIVETPADGDFLVFPPQGVVEHNQRQMVRVQWLGGQLDSSRAYYVSINQLRVQLDPTKIDKTKPTVDVQLVYHMKVLTTVAPPGAAPKVAVDSVKPTMVVAKGGQGATEPGVSVTVSNTGKRYAMLAGASWTIEGKGLDGKPLKVVLPVGRMTELLGAGYVPALNGHRTFEVPTGVQFANSPISVKFAN